MHSHENGCNPGSCRINNAVALSKISIYIDIFSILKKYRYISVVSIYRYSIEATSPSPALDESSTVASMENRMENCMKNQYFSKYCTEV